MARENENVITTEEGHVCWSFASWGAIFAGVVIVLAIEFVFGLLGLAIGLWSVNPTATGQMQTLGIGAMIWWLITTLISVFLGGWVAGRLAGESSAVDSSIHGIVTWGIATLITIWLVTAGVGTLISGAFGIVMGGLKTVGGAVGGLASVTGQAAQGQGPFAQLFQQMQQEAQQTIQQQTGQPPANQQAQLQGIQRAAATAITQFIQTGKLDQQQIIGILTRDAGMSQQQAEQTVQRWQTDYQQASAQLQQTYQQAKPQVMQTVEQTTKTLGTAAFWAFVTLILSLIAAGIGGAVGFKAHHQRYA